MTTLYKRCYLTFLVCLCCQLTAWAHQPIIASIEPSQSPSPWGFPIGVDSRASAKVNNNNYATVYSYWGEAWIQLKYMNILNAGTTSFIRVEAPGFTLSSIINDIVTIEAYNTANATSDGNLVASPTISVVQDQNYTYLAVTPSVQYNSVRIKVSTPNFQLNPNALRVFYSFYNGSDGADCGAGWAADIGEKSMGAAPASQVRNPGRAIDSDTSSYSTLQLTANQQNLQVSQTIYFPAASYISNIVQVKASVNSVFNPADYVIEAQAYFGLTAVGSKQDITTQVNVSTGQVSIYINPGSFMDRIKISIKANNKGAQTGHVNIHNVQLVPEPPTLNQNSLTICGTSASITLQVTNTDAAIRYQWYNNNNPISGATSSSYTANLTSAANPYTISVAAIKAGCTSESKKAKATIGVYVRPSTPSISLF